MDLKIEIRKLYALHRATIELHHGIRHGDRVAWTEYAPSQFVYAFFTFNSVYGFDWQRSFDTGSPHRWEDEPAGPPREEEQFKKYLHYASGALSPEAPTLFAGEFQLGLTRVGIDHPEEELSQIDLVNADKRLKNLARQVPAEVKRLRTGVVRQEDFHASCCVLLGFVYKVRCNLFHGSKTRVQLLDPGQQRRFLIYTSALIAADSLLFAIAPRAGIGWKNVEVAFDPRAGPAEWRKNASGRGSLRQGEGDVS